MAGNTTNQITAEQRKEEFYGVEGMVHIENDGMGDFSKYIPTEKRNTIKENLRVSTTEKIQYRVKQWWKKLLETLKIKK